jgi:hypothetical protein
MARSVADAAALLSTIAGSDPRDPATADAGRHAIDYTKLLDPDGLLGETIAALKAQGAVIVDIELGDPETTVLQYDFKHDIAAYLAMRSGLAGAAIPGYRGWQTGSRIAETVSSRSCRMERQPTSTARSAHGSRVPTAAGTAHPANPVPAAARGGTPSGMPIAAPAAGITGR